MALSVRSSASSAQAITRDQPDRVLAMATLRVSAAELDPIQVTDVLGMKPEMAARRGAPLRHLRDGRPILAPTGTWFATSTGRVHGDPTDHFIWALHLAERSERRLASLAPDAEIDLSLMLGGPEADVLKAYREGRSRLLPLLQKGSAVGHVTVDLPTMGEAFCFNRGERIVLPSL
jgi:hypothetical protein